VASAAWRDRKITDLERTDLREVARLLGVPADDALAVLDQARDPSQQSMRRWEASLRTGARVVLTGDMTTRACLITRGPGLV